MSEPAAARAAAVLAPASLGGQAVLVTGAGSGIGRAIALRMVELGAAVVGVGRHEETLAGTQEMAAERGGDFAYEVLDVRDLDGARDVVGEVAGRRGLTALVNNAGGQFFARATDISPGGWRAVLDLNLTAVFNLMRAAHPFLARDGGSIVNISLSGVERGGMGMAHSIAARAGVLGLSRTVALEWAADRIRVNCLGPGTVLSAALDEAAAAHVRENLIARATPMRRATAAAEVAEVAAFLVSPAGAMMTGQLVQVDGGAHLAAGLHMLDEAYA